MVFGRNINGKTFTFGVSGLLRQSNVVIWDRETESWWQQGTFEAIVGTMTGTKLEVLPAQVVSFRDFKAAFPQGTVLPGLKVAYNPYYRYDSQDSPSSFFTGELDRRLHAKERVIGVQVGDEVRAYLFQELAKEWVVHETVGGKSIVIFYEPDTTSVLDDTDISQSRNVDAASVFVPRVGDHDLSFDFIDEAFVDRQTGTTWDILGYAVDGPLKGERLPPLFHTQSFWFYWAAISEETTIYQGSR